MAALAKDRDTPSKHKDFQVRMKVKGSTTIYAGALVAADSGGFAVPAADTSGHKVIGRAAKTVVNGGADGAAEILVDVGIFSYATSGGSKLVAGDVGALAYVLDDNTIVKAAGTSNNVIAGRVLEHESDAVVWIDTRERG